MEEGELSMTDNRHRRPWLRTTLAVAALALGVGAVSMPASAKDKGWGNGWNGWGDGDWRPHQRQHHRDHRWDRGWGGGFFYAPAPRYFVPPPPPVYYPQPYTYQYAPQYVPQYAPQYAPRPYIYAPPPSVDFNFRF
jgi:hypothetical protein